MKPWDEAATIDDAIAPPVDIVVALECADTRCALPKVHVTLIFT